MALDESKEVELKLELDPGDCDRIDWATIFEGQPRRIRQRAIYFDTPDHDLAKAGLSLRIRSDGTRYLQTVKAKQSCAGMFVRSEWEFEVEHETLVLDSRSPVSATLGERVDQIVPIFTVENERDLWDISGVEVALDRARVSAGGKTLALCEIEFEAKGCEVAMLFGLARKVAAEVPVDVGVVSKSERGYRLLHEPSGAAKAAAVTLKRCTPTPQAFLFIVQSCLTQFRLNVPLIVEHADPNALHQARIALRRLRTAISVFSPLQADSDRARWNDLGWLAAELGKARDLDVLLKRVEGQPIAATLAEARNAAYKDVESALKSQRARNVLFDLVAWINIGDWLTAPSAAGIREMPISDFASEAMERLRKRLKKRSHKFRKLDDLAMHDVRKAAKKLRYASDFFAPLFRGHGRQKHARKFTAALETLQDRLGAINDAATASAIAKRLGLDDNALMLACRPADAKEALVDEAAKSLRAMLRLKRFWR